MRIFGARFFGTYWQRTRDVLVMACLCSWTRPNVSKAALTPAHPSPNQPKPGPSREISRGTFREFSEDAPRMFRVNSKQFDQKGTFFSITSNKRDQPDNQMVRTTQSNTPPLKHNLIEKNRWDALPCVIQREIFDMANTHMGDLR